MMKIEQLLHGYDNGHRLLAGSILLRNNIDMEVVDTLSDWSEFMMPGGGLSYLTAYSLQESGYYILAKTWYADEMKRPGCVWTHSLLIPFIALNSVDDFRRLYSLFKRPSLGEGLEDYARTIEYENKNYTVDDYRSVPFDREKVECIFRSFLNIGIVPLVFEAQKENELVEDAILAVMNTLPQSMLQNLSWCTGTAYIRKLNGKPLTCQFVSRIATGSHPNNSEISEQQWQTYVIDAVMRGDVNQGQLIRMFSEDIGDKAENYAAIVKSLYILEDYFKTGQSNEDRYMEALRIVSKAFFNKNKGQVIKRLLVNKTFTDKYCDNYTFFLYFATLKDIDAFDVTSTGLEDRWKEFVGIERIQYISMLGDICKSGNANSWGVEKIKESVTILLPEEVAEMIKNDFQLFSSIALFNPELLNETPWLVLSVQEIELVLQLFLNERVRNNFRHWEGLFATLLEKGVDVRDDFAKEVFSKTDKATEILLNFINKDPKRNVSYVFRGLLGENTDKVLIWLGNTKILTDNVAYAIINAVNEQSSVVINRGAKIWKSFLGLQFCNIDAKVPAYLFALSFNWLTDLDALELMRVAFYPLHTLQAKKKLDYINWSHIAPYMESLMIWDEWDNCKKMRKTIVGRLKRSGVDMRVLDNYTPDEELNAELKRLWENK